MVMKDLDCWAKACFEHTDFGTHAVVSVVTAFHYSVDGENFYMMRQFHLPVEQIIKVGLLAQVPIGNGGLRIYENLSIEQRTVKNIRAGK